MQSYRSYICLSLLLIAANAAQTADARQADLEPIEEIQVTATRRPVPGSDVSTALTLISSEEIAAGTLVTDSLTGQPGVFLQQTTPGQGAPIIRGLKGSEVLHLVDGMRLNNAIFRNAPTQYLALVAPGTLDRIEIVRGAPASLYGNDAVGGVVQALSRIPRFDTAGSRRELFTAFDTADLARIIRGAFEFGDEKLAALVSGEYLDTGNRYTGSGARVGAGGFSSRGARIAVSATPTEEKRWLFDVQLAGQPMTPRIDELTPGFGQTEPSSSEFFFAPNDRLFAHIRHSRDNWILAADWNIDLGWQRIVDDTISRDYQSDNRRYEQNQSDLYGITASATRDFGPASWIAGAEFYHDTVGSNRIEENLLTGERQTITPRFPDGSTVDQAAVFANVMHNARLQHAFSGGVRFSAIRTRLAAAGASPATTVEQGDISADLGWIYSASEAWQLTANLGYGFRAPNVFDLGTLGERPGNRFNIPSPDLQSERVTQLDAGLRHRGTRVDIDVVLFWLHYADRITSVLTGDLAPSGREITQSRNTGKADIYGVEVAAVWRLNDEIDSELVLNYLRGEQNDVGGADVPADRIPPFNGKLSVRYQWSTTVSLTPYLQFASAQSRLSPRDVQDSRIDPHGTPGWLTANIAGTLDVGERWQVSARLENLLDQRYRVHGSGIDATGRNFYFGIRAVW